jgi:heme oxygenase
MTAAPKQALAVLLKVRTREHHRRAERAGIVARILQQSVSHEEYRRYLHELAIIYAAMEERLSALRDHPTLAPLAAPGLVRSPSIKRDLARLAPRYESSGEPMTLAGARYRDRLLSADLPMLVAHAYVRYLGDLNGGQSLCRLLTEALNLDPDSLSFYRFDAITDLESFVQHLRHAIDRGVASDDHGRVVEEAVRAFEFNILLAEAVVE